MVILTMLSNALHKKPFVMATLTLTTFVKTQTRLGCKKCGISAKYTRRGDAQAHYEIAKLSACNQTCFYFSIPFCDM